MNVEFSVKSYTWQKDSVSRKIDNRQPMNGQQTESWIDKLKNSCHYCLYMFINHKSRLDLEKKHQIQMTDRQRDKQTDR